MLLGLNSVPELELYIDNAQDKQLYNWKAKYEESKGQWEKATKYNRFYFYDTLIIIFVFQFIYFGFL